MLMRERSKRMGKAVADPGKEEPASPVRWETALKDQVERVPAWRRAWPTPWHAGPALPLPRRPPRRPLSARAHHAPRRSLMFGAEDEKPCVICRMWPTALT